MDLLAKLAEPIETGVEKEKIELKRQLDLSTRAARAEFAKNVSAIANTEGEEGYIIIGVLDKKERESSDPQDYVVGFEPSDLDGFIVQMNKALSFYCDPPPKIKYHRLEYPPARKAIGVVEIPRSFARPHAIRRTGEGVEEHDIWVRRGPACFRASPKEIEKMIRGQRRVLVVNFSHPLTEEQKERARLLLNCRIEEIIELPIQLDHERPFDPQIDEVVDKVGLTSHQWQTKPVLVNLPGYAPAAAVLIAELHGRMGHFPTILRLRPVRAEGTTTYEVAEIIDLQATRDAARGRR